MIVNKPQFDTNILKPGEVISAVSQDWHDWAIVNGSYERKILLTDVDPLKLVGVYYDEPSFHDNGMDILGKHKIDVITIRIEQVVSGSVKICEMKKVNKE